MNHPIIFVLLIPSIILIHSGRLSGEKKIKGE
jgi:hypothetical protein